MPEVAKVDIRIPENKKRDLETLDRNLKELSVSIAAYRSDLGEGRASINQKARNSIKSLALVIVTKCRSFIAKSRLSDLGSNLEKIAKDLDHSRTIEQESEILTTMAGLISSIRTEAQNVLKKQVEPLMRRAGIN